MSTYKTKPRYDIDKISAVKTLPDPERPFTFAELMVDGKTLRYCMSTPHSRWRVNTLFLKEPTTIEWLHSFQPNDVFVDIGANVGIYTLYAGIISGARVYAFEPESQNYAELCRSILLNAAHHKISAYCAAVSDKPLEISNLILSDPMKTGSSFNDFAVPSHDYSAASRFTQGCIAVSLDYLIETKAIPVPKHVKIDVDGHETKVFEGMKNALQCPEIRTLLLECDPKTPNCYDIVKQLLAGGWIYNADQIRLSRHGLESKEAAEEAIVQQRFAGNIIFARDASDLKFATKTLERFSAAELEAMRVTE